MTYEILKITAPPFYFKMDDKIFGDICDCTEECDCINTYHSINDFLEEIKNISGAIV